MPRATAPLSPLFRKSKSSAKKSFRVGRVKAYLRGRCWYLQYQDGGVRHRPRIGPDADAARRLLSAG